MIGGMQRLADASELLDGPLTDLPALAGNLRDLRRINRLGGGAALSRRALKILLRTTDDPGDAGASSRPVALIDVGTGAADIPVGLLETWRERRPSLTVLAVDSRPEVLEAARIAQPTLPAVEGLTMRVADGRDLPFADDAFDVAHASMVVHHLEPDEAVTLLAEMRRVARRGVIVNDLARGRGRWLLAWLVLHLASGNRLTRHDGPLSVLRSYTPDEMDALLDRAGLRRIHLEHGPLRLRWAIAAVPR
jgi:SAM-dependent methyltransferase